MVYAEESEECEGGQKEERKEGRKEGKKEGRGTGTYFRDLTTPL